jgi:tyrosinase
MTSSFFDRKAFSRREFLSTTAAIGAVAVLPGSTAAQGTAKYTRYNVTSPQGQTMLQSYAVAIEKMLTLPPTDPRNWFRNAFIHTLDCPHGNWWFFVWHRGYLGWFERTIRELSDNPSFAIPYWDWTQLPQIPDAMFNGVLTPTDAAFNSYISSYDTFYNYMNPALTAFWNSRTPGQVHELNLRGYTSLDVLWDQVKNNPMYATTPNARYLSRQNPQLDPKTAAMCSIDTLRSGLAPTTFIPFNSGKTTSHTLPPTGSTKFGILEGLPHNNVHNNIGGVNHVPVSDLGYMQDNLSPTDPIFFLHHANMDRLWDVWTRKQQKLGMPALPVGRDRAQWWKESFLFFIDAQGKPVRENKAGDYATIGGFDYDYELGSGDEVITPPPVALAAPPKTRFAGKLKGQVGVVAVPAALLKQATESKTGRTLVAQVTLPHPSAPSAQRNFDVLVNAPPGVTSVDADSPYYAGTIAFFGYMPHRAMDATFHVPLTKVLGTLKAQNKLGANELQIRIVPQTAVSTGLTVTPPAPLQAVSVQVW